MISQSAQRWLFISAISGLLPFILELPVWATGLWAVMLLLAGLRLRAGSLSRLVSLAAVLVAIISCGIFANFQAPLISLVLLLGMASALKLLEVRSRRDAWVVIFANGFVISVSFLFNSSMLAALYGFLSLLLLLLCMLSINSDESLNKRFKLSFSLLLQALPLALLLFLLFPRIAPLWQMGLAQPQGRTGLSDSLSPGEISNLLRSDEMAFRVSFDAQEPIAERDRYWRAMTFSLFDGERWRLDSRPTVTALAVGEGSYQVIAERAAQSRYLISLAEPSVGSSGLVLLGDGTIRAAAELERRTSYRLNQVQLQTSMTEQQRQRYLQLPRGNPRARALAQSWRDQGLNQRQIVDQVMNLYRQDFHYTLSPPTLSGQRVDQFLFNTQRGYCEHFASASGFLLRAAGVPTRLVGGYLGGEWNPFSRYLLIRERDAHAWVEVWLDGRWQRLDPTAVVAPERIEQGIETLLQETPELAGVDGLNLLNLEGRFSLLAKMRLRYDSLNYQWHRWVLGYDRQQEQLLSDWFGKWDYSKAVLVLMLPAGCLLLGLAWWLFGRTQTGYNNPVARDLQKLSVRAAKQDVSLARQSSETLRQYCERLAVAKPQKADVLAAWCLAAEALEYGMRSEALTKVYQRRWRQLYRWPLKF